MWVTTLLLIFLVLIVFGFVLEPIIRAKRDQVVIDSLNLPDLPPGIVQEAESNDTHTTDNSESAADSSKRDIDPASAEHNT